MEIKLFTGGHEQYREAKEQLRMVEDGEQRYVDGRGIVFDVWTELVPGRIRERIMSSAVEGDILNRDITCLSNHNSEKLLGRTGNGTMTIRVQDDGVYYRSEIPPTTYGEDLKVNLARNAVFGSSFIFVPDIDGMEITEGEDGMISITHNKMEKIRSIDPVFTPQYKTTTANMRSIIKALDDLDKSILDNDAKVYKSLARANYEMFELNLKY